MGFGAIVLGIYWFISARRIRLVFLGLAASSTALLEAGAKIGTYSLAMFFAILGYALLFSRLTAPLRYGIGALAIGFSTSSKLNHICLFLPILFLAYAERREIRLTHALAVL